MEVSPMKNQKISRTTAFTLIELLVVIAIIAILASLSSVAYAKMKEKGEMVKHVNNVKNFTIPTLAWAADNSQTLPSPVYPGGHSANDPAIPEQWDFAGTGSGLWLDGVIYYAAMYRANNERAAESGGNKVESVDGEDGKHLEGTFFASMQSKRKDPGVTDWHRHSYAMNSNLQYDYLYANSSKPYLTNKSLARITHRPAALLFIENENSNVVDVQSREEIVETGKKRWSSKKVIASFLDGSVRTLGENEIPSDAVSDLQGSRFWHGVDPER